MTRPIFTDSQIAELLASLSDHEHFVFLDTSMTDSMNRQSLLFTHPAAQLQFRMGDSRNDFMDMLQQRLQEGYYLAGWLSYEFLHDEMGLGRDIKCAHPELLADLGVYRAPDRFDHTGEERDPSGLTDLESESVNYRVSNLQLSMDERQYCDAIRAILKYIAAGDTYQVNYTFKLNFDFNGSVQDFYRDLRRSQPVPYGAFIKNGSRYTLSLSPELFFKMEPDTIIARPMKGTMKRGRNRIEDEAIVEVLRTDVKNRSENVMIVDLLRNDLSRLVEKCGGGTVDVASLFDVERYRTVLQMTSSIVARRFNNDPVSPRRILDAIFPCGSVTGAPKIRTMEIIDELENGPRGVYTGAIGYFSPVSEAVFNVPIRTVVIDDEHGEMGIGSGIVSDSSPEDEWRECLLKAQFLTKPIPRYKMIETMLHHPQHGFVFLDDHLRRLRDSSEHLGLFCDEIQIRATLEKLGTGFSGAQCTRVRLTLNVDGEVNVEQSECATPIALTLVDAIGRETAHGPGAYIDFAPESTDSSSPWLYHKTSRRDQYNRVYAKATADGLVDMIFCNERGELTEGAISNIIVELNGVYYTPPVSCGLLPGVMRGNLLRDNNQVKLRERILYREDLSRADALFICNGVRGVVPVILRQCAKL